MNERIDPASLSIEAALVRGFAVVGTHPNRPSLRGGARVRHSSHRWGDAIAEGTGEVVTVMRRGTDEAPDSWEQQYGRPNIEVIVRMFDGEISVWADYHTEVVDLW